MIMQLLLDAATSMSMIILVAAGFALVYWIAGFVHFAHGGVYVFSAYCGYEVVRRLHISSLAAVPIGALFGILLGVLIEVFVYRPLTRRNAHPTAILLASLGALTVLEHLVAVIWGDGVLMLQAGPPRVGFPFAGGRITGTQIASLLIAAAVSLSAWALLRATRFGIMMRAVGSNRELAAIFGINVGRVVMTAMILGSALAGVAGVLRGIDVDLVPGMGFRAMLLAIVVVVLGGASSISGLLLAAGFVAVTQQVAIAVLPGEWQDEILFSILLGMLALLPRRFGAAATRWSGER